MNREEKREKLVEILKIKIYPRENVDPAEVVADFLMDNGVEPVEKAHWIKEHPEHPLVAHCVLRCSNCGRITIFSDGNPLDYCAHCGAQME